MKRINATIATAMLLMLTATLAYGQGRSEEAAATGPGRDSTATGEVGAPPAMSPERRARLEENADALTGPEDDFTPTGRHANNLPRGPRDPSGIDDAPTGPGRDRDGGSNASLEIPVGINRPSMEAELASDMLGGVVDHRALMQIESAEWMARTSNDDAAPIPEPSFDHELLMRGEESQGSRLPVPADDVAVPEPAADHDELMKGVRPAARPGDLLRPAGQIKTEDVK